MIFDASVLAVVAGFMVLANRLVDALVTPLFDKFGWDKFPIMYIAWAISGILVALTGVNLFGSVIPNALAGQILTAIVAGGGANLLHDFTDSEIVEITAIEDEAG